MNFDLLAQTSCGLYLGLALMTLASVPKRDREPRQLWSFACTIAGTLLAYCSGSLVWFTAGWALTVVPYWVWIETGPRWPLTAGTLALVAGTALHSVPGAAAQTFSFGALMLAVLLRKGIFPLHSWVPGGLEQSPPLLLGLLLNGHLGAFLILRFAIPLMPEAASLAIVFLSGLALFTAVYTALLALSDNRSLRILGLLAVSQASFMLAGIENRNVEGITGALVHWFVVAAATTGLLCAYRALEARYPAVANPAGYLGLASHAPRLAVFFSIFGLALIGLPGTLGFAAEDLLFHGSLESHPLLGIALPLATALNAITMYRLISRLFFGRSATATPTIPDALPRERWALAGAVVFLVVGGILPGTLISLRSVPAERIVALLGGQ